MLERFKYINSFNETLEFGKDCLFVNENDLRDFVWDITSKNNKISGFKKGVVSKTIPVILKCGSEAEGIELRNRLFEVFEKDVLTNQHGKIYIGDYYLRCFITGSTKSNYLIHKGYVEMSLTVQTDFPEWVKETTTNHTFSYENVGGFLDFPHDFAYDYKHQSRNATVINENFVPSNFILRIFGSVTNPTLYISGHKYSVEVTVGENEYLTIDSINKTIILTEDDGTKVNCFNNRSRDSYIFEKIPSGANDVTTLDDNFTFELTLFNERSEPKWT